MSKGDAIHDAPVLAEVEAVKGLLESYLIPPGLYDHASPAARGAASLAVKALGILASLPPATVGAGEAVDGLGWQDISTAPKDGTMVLVFNKHHGEQCVMGWTEGVMKDVFKDGFWSDVGGRNAAITMSVNPNYFQFWRPLPEPPCATPAEGGRDGA